MSPKDAPDALDPYLDKASFSSLISSSLIERFNVLLFKSIIENYLSYHKNSNDKFIVPSDLIVKKVNVDNGEISDGQNSIIDYFTKDQLEILDNINKIESIGGIN